MITAQGGGRIVEEFMLQRMIGFSSFGMVDVWLAVAYLVCMFAILGFRSQQIISPFLFRLSYILFAIALILPTFVDAIIQMSFLDDGISRRSSTNIGITVVSPLFRMIGRVLFGVSIICAMGALRKGDERAGREGSPIPPSDD